MEEQEQGEDAPENSTAQTKDGQANGSENAELNFRPRRSSILKKAGNRPVPKSVSFSSIPSEKKVTNGKLVFVHLQRGNIISCQRSWVFKATVTNCFLLLFCSCRLSAVHA